MISLSSTDAVLRSPRSGLSARLRRHRAASWAFWTTAPDLGQLDDRALRDIGLSRGDLPGAAARALRDRAPGLLVIL